MAVLKDLIVHGRSRFINGIDADSIHANLIDANDGVFKTITTTTLDAETITTDMLKANNARVSHTLTVDGTISTNKWEAANIANIGGNFYISPTGKADSGTITVTKTSSTTINGVTVGVYTLVVGSASFGVTSTNSTVWGPTSSNQSKVIFTGSISYNNSKKYPLGTCNGTMTTLSTGTNTLTGFTITGVSSPALDIFFQEVGVSSVSSTACNGYEMQISVYQTYSNSALRPVGILLTSYGKEKKQYIDIYNGENTLGDSASGFANPAVRIGLLDDLPNIVDNSTDTATKPSGWGIYTTNGFFKGKVVANAGRIATWNIGSSSIYSGTNSMTSTTQGTYIGTGTDATSGIRNYKDANTFVNISQGVITAKAVDLTGKITATSGSIAGWRIESSYLASGSATSPAANVLLLSPAGTTSSYTIAGQAKTGWVITAGTTFGVNKDGGIYATSGKIGGFDIGATYLRNGNIASATNTSVAGVYLGTDGFLNAASSTTYAQITNGVLTAQGAVIKGALTATSLSTGNPARISSGTGTAGTYIASDGAIYVGSNNNFTVTAAGAVTAKSGTIGGWSINSSYGIYTNSKTSATSTNSGILIQKDGNIYAGAYNSTAASCPFQVTNTGVLTAVNANLKGLTIYDAGTTPLGSFTASSGNATIKLGQETANKFNILITDSAVSGKGPGILLRQGTNILNEITATGMKLYLANNTTNSIAEFSENTRVGKESGGHIVMASDGIELWGDPQYGNDHTFIYSSGIAIGVNSTYGAIEFGSGGYINGHYNEIDENVTEKRMTIEANTVGEAGPTSTQAYIGIWANGSEKSAGVTVDVNDNENFDRYKVGTTSVRLLGDKVSINDDPIADFVIEQGTSGIWTYRKWNSGIAECWGRVTVASRTYAANGGYYNVTGAPPTGLFVSGSNPVLSATGGIASNIQTNIGFTFASDVSIQTYLINRSASTITNPAWVCWHLTGRWK